MGETMKTLSKHNLIVTIHKEGQSVTNTVLSHNNKSKADYVINILINLLQLFGGRFNDKFKPLRL